MDSYIEQSNVGELDNPPTLVAESEKEKIIRARIEGSARMSTDSGEDKPVMPVLQPNVDLDAGIRSKSGRIRKPARNFTSDEYVVPNLVKRRIPVPAPSPTNNVRASPVKSTNSTNANATTSTPPVAVTPIATPSSTPSEIDAMRVSMERKFPNANSDDDESPFPSIQSVCFKELQERDPNMSVADIHGKIRDCYKHWAKGPYRLREDEVKFVQECIVKPEWPRISMKEWRLLAEILKDRTSRMRKRFVKPNKIRVTKAKRRKQEDVKKCFLDLGNKFVVGKQLPHSDDDFESEDLDDQEDEMEDMDETSNPSSRISTRSRDAALKDRMGSKTSSVANDAEMDLSLGSVGMDDFAGDDIKEEMFDDLENVLVSETKRRGNNGNSMVAALHATLQKDGGPEFDPSQYEPPALEKDSPIFALDDIEESENACSFFENIKEPSFENAETPTGLTDEAFAELEQRVEDQDEKPEPSLIDNDYNNENVYSEPGTSKHLGDDNKFDVGSLEVEESSGSIRFNSNSRNDFGNPGVTMISTKTALMCALKISEDFLPSSHEKYLDRLEETDKYHHEELDDIRRKFNMRPSPHVAKRKMKLNVDNDANKRPKVGINKVINGNDKPKALPFLRSAYAKCRKFMEDETTVIEKLGNNKILAAGRVIEIQYESYLKEADVEIPFDDATEPMPNLPPPSVSNCHAPSCRLGCICSSISEDMPPRKHCGRPRCFFECTCQNILLNSGDDGDIRSRLRPRVSLLNWRAESTEKEKEPMTSYRQMERGTHFIRMRRNAAQPERLRREFVLDGKVVDRNSVKVVKERLRTKALIHSSHRRIMAKPAEGHRFVRMVPAKPEHKKVNMEQLKKKCTPLTVDVEHMDVEITDVKPKVPSPQKRRILAPDYPSGPRISSKDFEEMKSIIQEMTEDYQLLIIDQQIGFFSWAKKLKQPKVVMYQASLGDQRVAPWLYLPIPPQGHSWICHQLNSSFETTDYVYIPEVKCCISSHALKLNMNTAITKKKTVVFDVKTQGNSPGSGKIYFLPDLPKVLVCGPFKTDQSTVNPRDISNADKISKVVEHLDKSKAKATVGDKSWKRFTTTPTIFPIKKRNDGQRSLTAEESRKLFDRIYPSIIKPPPQRILKQNGNTPVFKKPLPPKVPEVTFDWSKAVKFVGFSDVHSTISSPGQDSVNWAEIITL